MRLITKTLGILALLFFVSGYILKNFSLRHADNLLVIGLMIFLLGFSPLFLKEKLAEETRRDAKISYASFFLSCVLLMVAAMHTILHLPGAGALNYFSLFVFMVYVIFFTRSQDSRKLRIRKDRQLAAILFSDIVGYTKMMGENEDHALTMLEQNRKIQKKWTSKFRGKWLKEMGDGTILIFYTVTEAILCAIEIQKEIKTSQSFTVRMGIHISEIVFTDTDAFGDGMNVASRISNVAMGGEIVFSESVYLNIRNREDLLIETIGEKELKNVDYAIFLYKITPGFKTQ